MRPERACLRPLRGDDPMKSAPVCDVAALAAMIPDGAKVAVPKDACGVAMAATRELVRCGVRGVHLVCVPVSGLQADILIGAGAVSTIETSAVTLGEFGSAPRFVAALQSGELRILDATCPAIHAALQAGQKGLPFIPLRGLIGTDVLARRTDWKVIENPFQPQDAIVVLPAIEPDFALFHAPLADRFGNVFIGRWREMLTMAHAARQTLVTVEQIVNGDLMQDPGRAPGTIPASYVTALACAPHGAWPLAFGDDYPMDEEAVGRYVAAARTPAGFREFVREWLAGPTEVGAAA
jgi:glutaconate CoA-transferase, subunit A